MNFLNIKNSAVLVTQMALLFTLFITFSTCTDNKIEVKQSNWQLVWEDEFEGPAGQSPDGSKWVYDIGKGPGNDGWGNAELQYYTDRPENVSLDGQGNLAITAIAESFSGSAFTSARIKTKGVFEQAYGRFEARMKMPYGPGIWPAFWLLGSDIDTNPWPQCGEIDVMEYRGQEPNIIHGSVHGPGYSGGSPVTKSYGFTNDRFDTEFHVFAIEWGENYINFFVDDVAYQQITPEDTAGDWVFDSPFFMLFECRGWRQLRGIPKCQYQVSPDNAGRLGEGVQGTDLKVSLI